MTRTPMPYSDDMTAKMRVFETLKNLVDLVTVAPDLNEIRDQLVSSLRNAASWEPLISNVEARDDAAAMPIDTLQED